MDKKIDTKNTNTATTNTINAANTTSLMQDFKQTTNTLFTPKLFVVLLIALVLGVGTGFFIARLNGKTGTIPGSPTSASSVEKGKIYGSDDTKTFKDVAEGILKEGGIEGEGAYHLVRDGGENRYVYLTSANLDLSQFIDRKIRVWGATQQAKKAPWLMEVGRIEVLE